MSSLPRVTFRIPMLARWLLLTALWTLSGCSAAPTATPTALPAVTPTAVTPTAAAPTHTPAPAPSPTPVLLPTWTAIPAPVADGVFVDPGVDLGAISPYIFGSNYGPWVSLRPETLPLAEEAGITHLRWPGGAFGDQNDATPRQVDQFVALARRLGAEPYIHVRFLDSTPEKAAELVRYANVEKGYQIRYWSIGNEPSIYEPAGEPWTAETFALEWRKFADAMKAVDPTIQLLGPETHQFTGTPDVDPKDSTGRDWLRTFLAINGDLVDVVTVHRYPFPNNAARTSATPEELLADPDRWNQIVRNLREVVRTETGRDLPVGITEFNSHWTSAAGGETTPDSFLSALWFGDVLARLIQERVEFADQFILVTTSSSGLGALGPYAARPPYYVFRLYREFGAQQVLASSSDPNITAIAARRDDGALTLMLINRSAESITLPLTIAGSAPGTQADVWRLDAEHNAEIVGTQPLEPSGAVTLPGRSMTLLVESEPMRATDSALPTAVEPPEVTIWAPYASQLEIDTLAANADLLREVNFFWYELTEDGQITGGVKSKLALDQARALGLRVVPSIVNRGFSREAVLAAIGTPDARRAHIDAIVTLVTSNGYDGIDIDYESLAAEDRELFTVFIEELATALDTVDKELSIAVHAKTDDAGTWNGPAAQDWARLGAAVDRFKIMTYDYHYGGSTAGPIAPLTWIDEVLRYAATVVPPEKTYAGIHFYGYEWVGAAGKGIEWRQAMKTLAQQGATLQRDASGEAWYTYDDDRFTVYFADAENLRVKLAAISAAHPELAGIAIWRLGGEDPANWAAIRTWAQPERMEGE